MMIFTCPAVGTVHQALPVPGLHPMLLDGAARFGRRTPEPHVWPAAPSTLARGDGWRGAAVNIENKIRGWRDDLRAEAKTRGLSPHDALLYYGDDSVLFEIIACELDDYEHCNSPAMAYGFRDDLIDGVKEKLISGELVAFADNPSDHRTRIKIPPETWRHIKWSDEAQISETAPLFRLGEEISGYRNVIIKTCAPANTEARSLSGQYPTGDQHPALPRLQIPDGELVLRAVDEDMRRSDAGEELFTVKTRLDFLKKYRPNLTNNHYREQLMPLIRKEAERRGFDLRGRGAPPKKINK